jgi:hypothetical protein
LAVAPVTPVAGATPGVPTMAAAERIGVRLRSEQPPAPPLTVPTAPTTIRLSAAITPIPRARTESAEARSYDLPPVDHSARSNQPLLATLRGERKAREAGDAELSAAVDKCAATSPAGHLSAQFESCERIGPIEIPELIKNSLVSLPRFY